MPFGSDVAPGEDDCDFDEHPVDSAATRVRKLAVRLTSTLPSNSRNFEYKVHGCTASTVVGRGVVTRDERRMGVPKGEAPRHIVQCSVSLPAAVQRLHRVPVDVIHPVFAELVGDPPREESYIVLFDLQEK
jgi:hypothetical protein